MRVGEIDRAVGGEAVVEQQVRGDAQVARPEPRHAAAGQGQAGELGHPQVRSLREQAVVQLHRHADVRTDQPEHPVHRSAAQAQDGRARRGRRGEHLGEQGRGQRGAPQVELAAGGERVGELRRRTVHGGPLVVIGGTSYHGAADRRPAGGPRRVSEW